MSKVKGVDPNVQIHTDKKTGAKQSISPYRLDLLPPLATLRVAEVLAYGAAKYGDKNWLPIPANSHLNHAMQHILAYLAGDDSDDHAGHAACRIMMFLERIELDKQEDE
jgi:hypothetical protein